MILGKSIDKAQIKKIPIRVWSLTDEINASLKSLLEENKEKLPEDKFVLLKAFYEATPIAELNKRTQSTPHLTLVPETKTVETVSTPIVENKTVQTTEQTTPAPLDPFEAAMLAEATANNPEPAAVPADIPAALDPFEAAMLAEVEAQKKAQNQEAAPSSIDQAVIKDVQNDLNNILQTSVDDAQTKKSTILAVAPNPTSIIDDSSSMTPRKNYTIADFLNLRKNGLRTYPEEQSISKGNCIIYDVQFDQILFFTEKPFKPGQEIVIEFQIHKTFTITAKIINIVNVGIGSRIISSEPANFRINAMITHEQHGDRTLLRNFLSKVDPIINTHLG